MAEIKPSLVSLRSPLPPVSHVPSSPLQWVKAALPVHRRSTVKPGLGDWPKCCCYCCPWQFWLWLVRWISQAWMWDWFNPGPSWRLECLTALHLSWLSSTLNLPVHSCVHSRQYPDASKMLHQYLHFNFCCPQPSIQPWKATQRLCLWHHQSNSPCMRRGL